MRESDPLGVFEDFGKFGFEKEKQKQEASDKMARAMEKAFALRNDFINDLSGTGGVIVKTVIDNLASRIETLIENDAECQAYKKVLADIYEQLQIPQKVAKRLAKFFEIDGAPSS